MVADLKRGTYFSDSTDASDSIAGAMESLSDSLEAMGDSITAAQERKMDSLGARNSSSPIHFGWSGAAARTR